MSECSHSKPSYKHLRNPAIPSRSPEKHGGRAAKRGPRKWAYHSDGHTPDQWSTDLQHHPGSGMERWSGHTSWKQPKGKWTMASFLFLSTFRLEREIFESNAELADSTADFSKLNNTRLHGGGWIFLHQIVTLQTYLHIFGSSWIFYVISRSASKQVAFIESGF